MKQFTHLFFDLDNTLWNYKENSSRAISNTLDRCLLPDQEVGYDQFLAVFNKHNDQLWKDFKARKLAKKDLMIKRFQQTFEELRIDGVSADEFNQSYIADLPKHKKLMEGARELLDYLSRRNYSLYIISNGFKEVQEKKLMSSGLESYFKKVFVSETVKTAKPGKKIFEYAVTSVNARKDRSLMIGDDWDLDVMGALRFGIPVLFYNPCRKKVDHNAMSGKEARLFLGDLDHLDQVKKWV